MGGFIIGFAFGVLIGGPLFGIVTLYRERKRVRSERDKRNAMNFGN